ncbi:GntR family transcriptional regulator [Aquimarina sp. 2201CG5-10]|uniref:GntR family transcriptional regulator n=1 Tax=Aquimarina callyspongiae TaxID=3098150 RepID=UPI002AB5C242|nr:GntR family transcriptional regulator [Aquimarina sp. 2201CG5-10]MDY8137966.1 GntR family transcriptional regulator [Aquimarina sp. 2201CG5-10]
MNPISIRSNTSVPKYKQIIVSVEEAILNGVYKRDDKLPSINSIRNRFSLSRDTVLLAYNDLKLRGIIQAIPGKGYYIKSENISTVQKIFLLFDELNAFKEDLYNSFLSNLDEGVEVDIFFHHFNLSVFSKLIYDNIGIYHSYIIMPANLKNTHLVIEKLPTKRVYILDQTHKGLQRYPGIFQNFEKDLHKALHIGLELLKKYQNLVLLFEKDKQPTGILKGFKKFCIDKGFKHEVIDQLNDRIFKSGEVYLIPDDRNLIRIIKKVKEQKLVLCEDIGIVSYNDTLLKEIVEGGITTISTDFKKMGERLAQMIMQKENLKIENPNHLIIRNSL